MQHRPPDPQARYLDQHVKLLDVFVKLGIIKEYWKDTVQVHCPFHGADEHPSAHIYPDNHFFCFKCRGRQLGPIGFVMRHQGVSFHAAKAWLIEQFQVAFPKFEQPKHLFDFHATIKARVLALVYGMRGRIAHPLLMALSTAIDDRLRQNLYRDLSALSAPTLEQMARWLQASIGPAATLADLSGLVTFVEGPVERDEQSEEPVNFNSDESGVGADVV